MKLYEALDLLNNNGYIIESLNSLPYDLFFMRLHNYIVKHKLPDELNNEKDYNTVGTVDDFIDWLYLHEILRNNIPSDTLILFNKDKLYDIIPEKDFNNIIDAAHWYNCSSKADDKANKVAIRRGDIQSTNFEKYIVTNMPFLHLSYADDAVLKACGLRPKCKNYLEKYPPRIYLIDLNKHFSQILAVQAEQHPKATKILAQNLMSNNPEIKKRAINFMLHLSSTMIDSFREQLAEMAIDNGTEFTTKDGKIHKVKLEDYHAYLITINDNMPIYADPAFDDGVYVTNKIHPKNITRVPSDIIGF